MLCYKEKLVKMGLFSLLCWGNYRSLYYEWHRYSRQLASFSQGQMPTLSRYFKLLGVNLKENLKYIYKAVSFEWWVLECTAGMVEVEQLVRHYYSSRCAPEVRVQFWCRSVNSLCMSSLWNVWIFSGSSFPPTVRRRTG